MTTDALIHYEKPSQIPHSLLISGGATVAVLTAILCGIFSSQTFWPIIANPALWVACMLSWAVMNEADSRESEHQSALRISSYLKENYGIVVAPNDCWDYSDKAHHINDRVIDAEDSNGDRIKITLELSKDCKEVIPKLIESSSVEKLSTTVS